MNERHLTTGRVLAAIAIAGIAGAAILLVGGSQIGVWLVFIGIPLGLIVTGALFVRRTIVDHRTTDDRFAQRRAIHAGEDVQELRSTIEELADTHPDWESDEHLDAIADLETEIEETGIDVEPDARTVTLSAPIDGADTDTIETVHDRIDEGERAIAASFAEYSEPVFETLDAAIYQLVTAELIDERPETIPPNPDGKTLDLQDCREISTALQERRSFLDDALDHAVEELRDRSDDPDAPTDLEGAIETATEHREAHEYAEAVDALTTVVDHVDDPLVETDVVIADPPEAEPDEDEDPTAVPADDPALDEQSPAERRESGVEPDEEEIEEDSAVASDADLDAGTVTDTDEDTPGETGDDTAVVAAPPATGDDEENEGGSARGSDPSEPRRETSEEGSSDPTVENDGEKERPEEYDGAKERTEERQIQDDRALRGDTVDEDDGDSPSDEGSGFVPAQPVDSDDDSDEPLTRGGGRPPTDESVPPESGDGDVETREKHDDFPQTEASDESGGDADAADSEEDAGRSESERTESTDGGIISTSAFEAATPQPVDDGSSGEQPGEITEPVVASVDESGSDRTDDDAGVPDDARFDDEPVKEVIEEPIRDEATEEYTDHDVIADPWGDPDTDSETDIATERFKGGVVDETLDDIAPAEPDEDDADHDQNPTDEDAEQPLFSESVSEDEADTADPENTSDGDDGLFTTGGTVDE